MRDSAQRLGLTDFWRWWTGELRGLVPARARHALQRRRLHPVLVFHGDVAVLWQLEAESQAAPEYREAARIPLQGDANATAQAGRAAIDSIVRRAARGGIPRVVIALTPQQVLRKQLTYPATVEPNLEQVLGYDLDRHTPFKSDELYYDAAIVARDASRSEIRVELVAALRSLVDQLRRQAGAWGAEVVAIVPAQPHAGATAGATARLNLLPEIDRREPAWKRWQMWVPVTLAVTLAGAAIAVPLLQKRELAISLLHQTEQARVQAAAADALRQQLEQSVDDYNFVLGRKYAYPSTVQLLDDVTRLLPDDTWLTQLELKAPSRGKDPRREILLRGESANAGRLVSLLEDSQLFEQAAPRSPTTKIQPGPGEIFDLGAQLKPLPMPSPVPIGLAANTPDPNVPVGNAARPASSASQPGTPAVTAGTAPAGAPATTSGTAGNAATSGAPAQPPAPASTSPTSAAGPGATTPAVPTGSGPRPASRPVAPAAAATPAAAPTPATPAQPAPAARPQPMPAATPPPRPTFGPLAPDGTVPGATN